MSLSKPNETKSTSPVAKYYKWNGSTGTLTCYDKATEKTSEVSLPFTMIPLDQFSFIEGYNQKAEKGFRSNEVKSTAKEKLTVRWNQGSILTEGFYKDIKAKIEDMGGSYHQSIYFVDKQMNICHLKFKGSALSEWLNLQKAYRNDIEGNIITINKSDAQKTGMVTFFKPQFTLKKSSDEIHDKAVKADEILQEYISNRSQPTTGPVSENVDTSELSEEERKQLKKAKPEKFEKSNIEPETMEQDDFFNEGFK